jgi:hypothetical protein
MGCSTVKAMSIGKIGVEEKYAYKFSYRPATPAFHLKDAASTAF